MSDKPLAERLRDSKAHTYSSENADYYIGFDQGHKSAAVMVELFAAEHLAPISEPPVTWTNDRVERDAINAERRRTRELLVGKETK